LILNFTDFSCNQSKNRGRSSLSPEFRYSLVLSMSHSTLALQQFMKAVPVCEPTTSLEALQAIFSSGCDDTIVVLSEQGAPLGIVTLKKMMPYFPCRASAGIRLKGDAAIAESPLQEIALNKQDVIQPIAILPSQMSVEEFWPYLQAEQLGDRPDRACALVDAAGKFQGLLDGWRLLKIFASVTDDRGAIASVPDQLVLNWGSLFQLLDKLPMPLMLRTADGDVQHQNSTWRSQIGTAAETDEFEGVTPTPSETDSFVNAWCNLSYDFDNAAERSETTPESNWAMLLPNPQSSKRASDSQAARARPGTVWQFVKFPFNLIGENRWSLEAREILNLQAPLWLVLATDITEQRQLCKELAAKNADLVQLNRLKDEFLACISHELKTPLTAVLGLSSLLKDQKLGELTQRQARYAQLIYQSGRQLMTVVNDILDLTRIEAGQLKLTLAPVKLREVCERAHEQTLAQLSAKEEEEALPQINFALEIEAGLEEIVADELRLRQMLVHLLDNAIKFTPPNGNVGLKVSRWEGWIDFTVWDTGIGIPEASQHLIFQKFQQLESPLTRQHEGTGLGLVLTQRLASAHGGDISFISKVGQGSQFTLLLPPNPYQKDSRFSSCSLTQNGNQLVMIVESTPPYIERLNEQLRALGYRVAIARSGTEALEKARQLQPCAILINPLLPLLSGWDVLTLLKADARTKTIPAIVMATAAERNLSEQNCADGFLTLPVEKSALQESLYRLGKTLDRRDRGLTILRLNPDGEHSDEEASILLAEFDVALSAQSTNLNYRLLATDDLEQADVLARVWKPDVLLLDGVKVEDPLVYLRSLSQHSCLANLPLVTLDAKTTAAANQIRSLAVFPCLIRVNKQSIAALLQVIQIAAGISNQPHIIVIGEPLPPSQLPEPAFSQQLLQYLQKAGLKSNWADSWAEIYQQIQQQKIDAIVVEVSQLATTAAAVSQRQSLLRGLRKLAQFPIKPPVLVLDRRPQPDSHKELELNALLHEVATEIIDKEEYSCADVLINIHHLLPKNVG
jgi:signal transduction histidine kinase/DNA-binding response OmpR family regulator